MSLRDLFRIPRSPEPLGLHPAPGVLCAPCSGKVASMGELPDPVFSSGMMGKAVGVWPEGSVVYAPVSGTVTVAMPHAIGISSEGIELLVHVGVDTVQLEGKCSDLHVRKGDQVSAGDVMLVMDRDRIARAGYPDVVMCAITNSGEIEESGGAVTMLAGASVAAGDPLVRVELPASS